MLQLINFYSQLGWKHIILIRDNIYIYDSKDLQAELFKHLCLLQCHKNKAWFNYNRSISNVGYIALLWI